MNQPSKKDQLKLLTITTGKDIVQIPRTNKTVKIGWMKGITLKKLSLLELKEGVGQGKNQMDEIRNSASFIYKAASICILNGLKIHFLHWAYWRYLYIKYSFDQLEPIVKLAKKKVPARSWYYVMGLISQMRITNMMMTEKEGEQLQAELSSGAKQR